jgi:hypothetical protein
MAKQTDKVALKFLERIKKARPQLEQIPTKCLGVVYMRKPTGADQLRIAALKQEISKHHLAMLPQSTFAAVMCSVLFLREDGEPMFSDAAEGYRAINEIGAEGLEELYKIVMRLLGADKKALEVAEKKSGSSQSSDSGTTSRS